MRDSQNEFKGGRSDQKAKNLMLMNDHMMFENITSAATRLEIFILLCSAARSVKETIASMAIFRKTLRTSICHELSHG